MRLLMLSAAPFTPDRDAGSLRAARLVELAGELGWNVTLAAGEFRRWQSHLALAGGEYDAVWLSGVEVAQRFLEPLRRYAPRARVVFDTVDLAHLREYRHARLTGDAARLRHALELKRQELELARAVDITVLVSEADRAVLAWECPGVSAAVVTSMYPLTPTGTPFSERRGLLFVGGFRHAPNADAVLYFAREILPRVRERIPDARLTVVGSDPPREVQAFAGELIEVVGHAPDPAPWHACARVSVAPLRFGAGVKGKVLDSMARGVPVVGTRVAAEGIARAGDELLVADGAEAFARDVERLYGDPALWERVRARGLARVEEGFSSAVVRAQLARVLYGESDA